LIKPEKYFKAGKTNTVNQKTKILLLTKEGK
jgi:hypothetical protein